MGLDPNIGERYHGYHSARCFEDGNTGWRLRQDRQWFMMAFMTPMVLGYTSRYGIMGWRKGVVFMGHHKGLFCPYEGDMRYITLY